MILSEESLRKPSRIAFWTVLVLGALLLPLAPQLARTEPPEEPQRVEKTGPPQGLHIGFPITTTFSAVDTVPNKLSSAKETDRSEEIEDLQDQIELLKVQVRAKEARIEASKKLLEEHKKRLAKYERIRERQPGAIPTDTIQEVQLVVTTHEGQLKIYEAELQEHLLRIKHAQRRLARLQGQKQKSQIDNPIQTAWNITWVEALFDQKTTRDLGKVQQGAIVETQFAMTNHGQHPVHIASIRSSAGCLTATASPPDLPPGKSAAIRAKLDTGRFTGSKTFEIFVEFDKPERKTVVLEIHAESVDAGAAKPRSPERLRELEKKLDALQKEMENLRREMNPDKPR